MDPILESLSDSIIDGDDEVIADQVKKALESGLIAQEILDDALIPSMGEVGLLFEEGEYFVPEMLLSAGAMERAMSVLRPVLIAGNYQPKGTIVVGSVQGDLHDIGKKLVGMMLEGQGFEVVDLGVDVAPEKFLDTVAETKARIVGLSALLTTTMPAMQTTIELLRDHFPDVKVMIGGAPVSQPFANKIGAHGFGENSTQAVAVANGFPL